jgi:hypothetical protein
VTKYDSVRDELTRECGEDEQQAKADERLLIETIRPRRDYFME